MRSFLTTINSSMLLILFTLFNILSVSSDYTVLNISLTFASAEGASPASTPMLLKYSTLLRGNWQESVKKELVGKGIDENEHGQVVDYISSRLHALGFAPSVVEGERLVSDDALKGREGITAHDAVAQLLRSATIHSFSGAKRDQFLSVLQHLNGESRVASSAEPSDTQQEGDQPMKRKEKSHMMRAEEMIGRSEPQLFTSQAASFSPSSPQRDSRYLMGEGQGAEGADNDPQGDPDIEGDRGQEGRGGPRHVRTGPYVPWEQPSVLPAFIRKRPSHPSHDGTSSDPPALHASHRIIVYQTRGVYTGGTVALDMLYEQLTVLGFNALLCNDGNRLAAECSDPSPHDVAVTGEWCHEVLEDYLLDTHLRRKREGRGGGGGRDSHEGGWSPTDRFQYSGPGSSSLFGGRGVQYHLGFHHHSDTCRGHITVTGSHFLSSVLAPRVLGAYYLGCAMGQQFKAAHVQLLRAHGNTSTSTLSAEHEAMTSLSDIPVAVWKEDLIIVDPDLQTDYPQERAVQMTAPPGYRVVLAKGFTSEEMRLLLLRAKAVLDLAMPGAERLAGEGVLLGAIPVISNRWNGASPVDFPGVIRVDHQNASDVTAKVLQALSTYHFVQSKEGEDREGLTDDPRELLTQLEREGSSRFFSYVQSLWGRMSRTADTLFGSSYVHFILRASSLSEETLANRQVLALLFLFPLASIDLYVPDVNWYIRHHYSFFHILRQGGYIRDDPFEPRGFGSGGDTRTYAMVNIRSDKILKEILLSDEAGEEEGKEEERGVEEGAPSTEEAKRSKGKKESGSVVSDSVLSPPWGPVIVAVPTPGALGVSGAQNTLEGTAAGLVFSNPFSLYDSISTLRRDGDMLVLSLDRADTKGGEGGRDNARDAVIAVATAGADLDAFSCILSSVLLTAEEQNNQNSKKCGEDSGTKTGPYGFGDKKENIRRGNLDESGWSTVGHLMGGSPHPLRGNPDPSLVHSIVNTVPWLTYRTLVGESVFK